MTASGFARIPLYPTVGIAILALAACGGGKGSIGGVGGSSSGGGDSQVLSGTFTTQTATSTRTVGSSGGDTVFGAIDGQGNGFLADMSAASTGNQAVFRFSPASQPNTDTISGLFYAYFTGGTNNTIVAGGNLSGSYTTTSANLSFTQATTSFSTAATLALDNPALAQASLATIAGTYTAQTGSATSPAITTSTQLADTYTVTVTGSGGLTVSDTAGCTFTSTTGFQAVSTLDVYDLQATGTCPSSNGGNANNISLTGLAVYLPKGAKSPLGGGTLANPALLLELDDSEQNSNGPKNAFALLAAL